MAQTVLTPEPPAKAHGIPLDALMSSLNTSGDGLSPAEVEQRQRLYGKNVLPSAAVPGLARIFIRQFLNPLIYILLFAALLSLSLREWWDAGFVFLVLNLNAVIGAVQEYQAQRSAQALQQLLQHRVQVQRNEKQVEVEAEDIVPGDIVYLESGSKVPADIRLLSVQDISIDESLLTGESLAKTKSDTAEVSEDTLLADRDNMLFAGTLVIRGRARGVVTATAGHTELGRIAAAVLSGKRAKPPLLQRMETFTTRIGLFCLLFVFLIALVAWYQGAYLVEVMLIAVALAVAAIPEGLPVAMTVALSVGMSRMVKHNVIVRRLVAAETLGSCTMIAADKTGTLTINELTLRRMQLPHHEPWEVSGSGRAVAGSVHVPEPAQPELTQALERMARVAMLCNECSIERQGEEWDASGDAVDIALMVFAAKAGMDVTARASRYRLLDRIPYESERMFAAAAHSGEDETVLTVKGAFERVLPMCRSMTGAQGEVDIDRDAIEAQVMAMAADGYRVLVLADKRLPGGYSTPLQEEQLQDLTYLGLAGMLDPPRPEASGAIAACHRAGIDIAMITGDHPVTAYAVGQQLGLVENHQQVVSGETLHQYLRQGTEVFDRYVRDIKVFARADPHDKLEIVQSLCRSGHYVAVTGDGANDAPALRAAHVGVAMGKRGTDVAREASDIVITDDNFASIVAGVREGRIAYANVRKVIFLLISTGAAEILIFIMALLAGVPLPLTAVQLLWLNLVTQGIQDVGLAFEPGEGNEMKQRPRPPNQPIFNRIMIERCLLSGGVMAVVAFALYWLMIKSGMDTDLARNNVLLLLVLFENVQVFNSRSETRSAFRHNPFYNRILLFGTLGAQLVHIAAMMTPGLRDVLDLQPVSLPQWAGLLGLALIVLLVMELHKVWRRKYRLL